jgi:hypothetical protein
MKFSQEPTEIRQQRFSSVTARWSQLNTLRNEWTEKAVNFLILTNADGAVAVLSFMGASDGVRAMLWPRIALCCFAIGIISTGILIAKQFLRSESMFGHYDVESKQYLFDQIEWDTLNTRDDDRAKASFWDYAWGFIPFGLFVFGCVSGAISLFFA